MMLALSPLAVGAAGSSTSFTISADTLAPELQTGNSADFSVVGGLTGISANGSSTNFVVTPIANFASSSSSSSAAVAASSSSSSASSVQNGGNRRRTEGASATEESSSEAGSHSATPVEIPEQTTQNRQPTRSATEPLVLNLNDASQPVESTIAVSASSSESDQEFPTLMRTMNEQPFIALSVGEEDSVIAIITDENGVVLETLTVDTENGLLLTKLESRLTAGTYQASVLSSDGRLLFVGTIAVMKDDRVSPIVVRSFGSTLLDESSEQVQNIGVIVRGVHDHITGKATPHARMLGYYQSTLRTRYTTADEYGNFALPVPHDLEAGSHTVTIVEKTNDGTESHIQLQLELVLPTELHEAAPKINIQTLLDRALMAMIALVIVIILSILENKYLNQSSSSHTHH